MPDLWQIEAVRALVSGADVIVDAPTGAGKTRVFELWREAVRNRPGQAVYTVPTRALANDKHAEWSREGWRTGLATGDAVIDPAAPVVVATLETQRERMLRGEAPALLAVDEYQMLADGVRGVNYELVVALAPAATRLLLLSGSVANPGEVAAWLQRSGRRVEVVRMAERPVPLETRPVDNLPAVRGAEVGYWARVALGVVAAEMAPLLIFAPRRREAERIAREIARVLPEDAGLALGSEAGRVLDRTTLNLLRRRVACHHSGLPFAVRAGWIEPLAKYGHLRVIVATTGLAAGINFSVRSVMVSGRTYQDGPFERRLEPESLLQMFGRAGRRGMDAAGYAVTGREGCSLAEAAPARLRRPEGMDWPAFLRVMEEASERGEEPFAAAEGLAARLFRREPVRLGWEEEQPEAAPASAAPYWLGPLQEEVQNVAGAWEEVRPLEEAALRDCLVLAGGQWQPAVRVAKVVRAAGGGGKVTRRTGHGGRYFFVEAVAARKGDGWQLLGWVRKQLGLPDRAVLHEDEVRVVVIALLRAARGEEQEAELRVRGRFLEMLGDPGDCRVAAFRDAAGNLLLDPPRRRVPVPTAEHRLCVRGRECEPAAGSAARAWRTLGLITDGGLPTRRGLVFARFQGGEGLMVAAALEQPDYPAGDIVEHLANLRGGHRLREGGAGESSRLEAAARAAFGHRDFDGHLVTGLNPTYGAGAREAIAVVYEHQRGTMLAEGVSAGDVERALLEWLGLLRQIVQAAPLAWSRWEELQVAAARCLARWESRRPPFPGPKIPSHLLAWRPENLPPLRRLAGFSLTELLVVLAVIGLLVALAVPWMAGLAGRAAAADSVATLRSVGGAAMLYAADHGNLPGPLWPGQVPIYDPQREGRLARELAPYLGVAAGEAPLLMEPMIPRAYRDFLRTNPLAEPRIFVMNMQVPRGEEKVSPWGNLVVSGGGGPFPPAAFPGAAWGFSEADQRHPAVAGAAWRGSTPSAPLHAGGLRAVWFFNGAVDLRADLPP